MEGIYWMLPKPADLSMILFDALDAGNSFSRLFIYQSLASPELSVLSSILFTLATLVVSGRQLAMTEY